MFNEFKAGDFVRNADSQAGVRGMPGHIVATDGTRCKVECADGVNRWSDAESLYRGANKLFTVGVTVKDFNSGRKLTVVHHDTFSGSVLCDDISTLTREFYAASRLAVVSEAPESKRESKGDSKARRYVSVMVDGRVIYVAYFYPDEKDWERKMMGTLKLYTMIPNSHVSVYTDDASF